MNEQDFKDKIEEWLSATLDKNLINKKGPKIIRDPVHGIQRFFGWEINFLDLPIIQRLRYIKQNAFAYLIYPGALQTRFDHTLGVSILTEKFANILRKKGFNDLDENLQNNLRIAAIFHDVGHGPLSHLSEEVYSQLDVIQEILTKPEFVAVKQNVKTHELLSYYIIKSDKLKELFQKANKCYPKVSFDIDLISESIIGNVSDLKRKYCQDIINGSFDADKLDYIQRDCYFTGLIMGVDVERIFHAIIPKDDGIKKEIALDISGSHNIEQLLFNKLLLHPSLYHHHKVRACTCMFKSIFEIVKDKDLAIDGKKYDNPVDFLEITDDFFFSYKDKPSVIQPHIKNLRNRVLFKRALVICGDFLNPVNLSTIKSYKDFLKWMEDPEKIRDFRRLICDKVKDITDYDVWLDFPKPPSLREASQCSIQVREGEYKTLDELFPTSGWLNTYLEHKIRGYVFCPPIKKIRERVHEISRKILKDDFNIELTEDCYHQCKIR